MTGLARAGFGRPGITPGKTEEAQSESRCRGHFIILALFACLLADNLCADNLYRYKSKSGLVILDDRLPPEYIADGYEVLSKSGRLLRVVPAHVDKPAGSTEQEILNAKERLREDKYILASYGSIEEIQQVKERKLSLLEREIYIIETNLADTRKQRAVQRTRAANYQRAGRPVPASLIKVLAEFDEQELKAEPILHERHAELASAAALYDKYKTRFAELTATNDVTHATSE